ncbi:hypothetical protein HZB00_03405 [Candidatus Woesearchaeota archaeon]|nr:hypothetical protein [Candidatus Woesearchaeota archaeon]
MVDEDLTQFFATRMQDPMFKSDKYPTYFPDRETLSLMRKGRKTGRGYTNIKSQVYILCAGIMMYESKV